MTRIAVVADIHHGAPSHTKRGDAALSLAAEFARFAADARADARIHREPGAVGFRLTEPDLLWLSRTGQAADRPLLVVSHVPLSGHAQTGNSYVEENPEVSAHPETPRLRAALAQARVPVVCLAGHVHWNTVTTVDGIPHLTQQSLTESCTTEGESSAAMGLIELGDTLRWRVEGHDPFAVELTPRAAPGRLRWPGCWRSTA